MMRDRHGLPSRGAAWLIRVRQSLETEAHAARHRIERSATYLAARLAKETKLASMKEKNEMSTERSAARQPVTSESGNASSEADAMRQMWHLLLRVAIPLWKAEQRLAPEVEESRPARLAARHLQDARDALEEAGIETRDYQGQRYDPGLRPVTPISFEERSECSHETIVRTLAPAVFVRGQLILKSEAIIGVPVPEDVIANAAADGPATAEKRVPSEVDVAPELSAAPIPSAARQRRSVRAKRKHGPAGRPGRARSPGPSKPGKAGGKVAAPDD